MIVCLKVLSIWTKGLHSTWNIEISFYSLYRSWSTILRVSRNHTLDQLSNCAALVDSTYKIEYPHLGYRTWHRFVWCRSEGPFFQFSCALFPPLGIPVYFNDSIVSCVTFYFSCFICMWRRGLIKFSPVLSILDQVYQGYSVKTRKQNHFNCHLSVHFWCSMVNNLNIITAGELGSGIEEGICRGKRTGSAQVPFENANFAQVVVRRGNSAGLPPFPSETYKCHTEISSLFHFFPNTDVFQEDFTISSWRLRC